MLRSGRHATACARIRWLLKSPDDFSKRFAKGEEMEKAGADTLDKGRRREKYWRVLLALKQFPTKPSRADRFHSW